MSSSGGKKSLNMNANVGRGEGEGRIDNTSEVWHLMPERTEARTDSDVEFEVLTERKEWELTDVVVWVTGASSGIGEELAYQLSKLGVSLVLSARRAHELERVKRRCLENGNLKGKDILVLPLDLADRSSHEEATKTVLQEFGKIDILVNNGGVSQRSLFMDTNVDVYKELIEINYLGTVSLTKCVLPHMIERKQGKIVIVNSLLGIISVPLSGGYCASKHALRVRLPKLNSDRTDLNVYMGDLAMTERGHWNWVGM
ncbi:hypothetical protein CB1_000839012 [Camelus ferus]|nr:hypothetical protein CB1_000839012 [Camelus ferus]